MTALIAALSLLVSFASAARPSVAQPPPGPVPAAGPRVVVSLFENRFRPARLEIAVGTTVVWQSDEADPTVEHNVISRDYRWASSNFVSGESYERTFDTPGEYRYFCDLHGGMTGRVVVQ